MNGFFIVTTQYMTPAKMSKNMIREIIGNTPTPDSGENICLIIVLFCLYIGSQSLQIGNYGDKLSIPFCMGNALQF